MFKKLRDKALKVNLKKSFIGLVIAGVVFAVGSRALLYQNFGDRVAQARAAHEQQWEQMIQDYETKTSEAPVSPEQKTELSDGRYEGSYGYGEGFGRREHSGRYGYGKESRFLQRWGMNGSKIDLESDWNLNTGDKVLVGAVVGIAAVFRILYWLLCMVWAYQKASKLGSNPAFWVIATFIFNLLAIAGLYIYAGFKGNCKKCGHIKQKGEKYCSYCGNEYETVCERCQSTVSADAAYCWNCGKSVNKEKPSNE